MKIGFVVFGIVIFGCSVFAKTAVNDGAVDLIDSIDSIQALWAESCRQYLPVSPPTSAPYVDSRKNVIPVRWKTFKEKAFTSQMYAEMDSSGFPIYRVGVRQEFSGAIVFCNSFGVDVLRLDAPKNFNAYAWAEDYFQLPSSKFSKAQLGLYPSSKIQLELFLLPEIFFRAYREIQAEQKVLPMKMARDSGGENEKAMANMTMDSNNLITLNITLPEEEVWGKHLEIFKKDNLILSPTLWEMGDGASWISTYGNTNVSWQDSSSSNQSLLARYYILSPADLDTDGDGYSDLREIYVSGTDENTFNVVDADNNGAGDGMHDWWEMKLFGSLTNSPTDNSDDDALLNGVEMVWHQDLNFIELVSDPSLSDTDADGLDDDIELLGVPPTDPWNDDVTAPVATILSPTNNTVVFF